MDFRHSSRRTSDTFKRFSFQLGGDENLRKSVRQQHSATEIAPVPDEPGMPICINWDKKDVGEYIRHIGYPQYKECFMKNFITGRRLILVNASTLPKIGVHDFEDIKNIARAIRKLLKIPFTSDNHCIADPHTDALGVFLEQKCSTKLGPDNLTLAEVAEKFDCIKVKPPLCNNL